MDDRNGSGKYHEENGDDNVNANAHANSHADKVIQAKNPTQKLVTTAQWKVDKQRAIWA
jgi:hypothetical protein